MDERFNYPESSSEFYDSLNEGDEAPVEELVDSWWPPNGSQQFPLPDLPLNNWGDPTFRRNAKLIPRQRRLSEIDSVLLPPGSRQVQRLVNGFENGQSISGLNQATGPPEGLPYRWWPSNVPLQIQLPDPPLYNWGDPTFRRNAKSAPRQVPVSEIDSILLPLDFSSGQSVFDEQSASEFYDSLNQEGGAPSQALPTENLVLEQPLPAGPVQYPPDYYDPLNEDDAAQAPPLLFPDNLLVERPLPTPPTNNWGDPYWSRRPRLTPRQILPLKGDSFLQSAQFEPLQSYDPSYWGVPQSELAITTPGREIPVMANVPAAAYVPAPSRIPRWGQNQSITNRRPNSQNQMRPWPLVRAFDSGLPYVVNAPYVAAQTARGQRLAAESSRIPRWQSNQSIANRRPNSQNQMRPWPLVRAFDSRLPYIVNAPYIAAPAARGERLAAESRGIEQSQGGRRRRAAGRRPIPIDQQPRWRY